MLNSFVNDIAQRMYVELNEISLVEGNKIGCLDAHLLHMKSGTHQVSALVYLSEFDDVMKGLPCEALEIRVMSTISRLKLMLEP